MKEIIKKMREENGGFTLAELLIVVAIIAVLVAIAIPVFTAQLERSREATDLANVRSAYSEAISEYLNTNEAVTVTVDAVQTQDSWQYEGTNGVAKIGSDINVGSKTAGEYEVPCHTSGSQYTIAVAADGTVTIS